MMEAAPATAFVMPETKLLFEVLIVALDAPAQLGEIDEAREADVLGQGGEPVLGRLRLRLRPLDQQPLFGAYAGRVVTRGTHSDACEPGGQSAARGLAPCDVAPCCFGQAEGQRLDRQWLRSWGAPRTPSPAPEPRPRPRRRRRDPRPPTGGVRPGARGIAETQRADCGAARAAGAGTRIPHH